MIMPRYKEIRHVCYADDELKALKRNALHEGFTDEESIRNIYTAKMDEAIIVTTLTDYENKIVDKIARIVP